MKKINVEICDSFLSMARKQETDVYGSTQTPRKVDVRFREEADYIYNLTKYGFDGNRWVKILHSKNLPANTPIMIDMMVEETFSGSIAHLSFLGNPYFKFFDTKQIVRVEGLPKGYK